MSPRIPLLPEDISEPKELVDSIRARRGGTLLALDRLLIYSPAFAQGWGALLKEVRGNFKIDPAARELAMTVVAVLTGAGIEVKAHAPLYLQAGGTQAQLDAIFKDIDAARKSGIFDAKLTAVLNLAVEMTRNVQVTDETFKAAKAAMGSDQGIVELIGVIATYNMATRFLVALDVQP